jgi:hypothetical protein
VEGKVGLRGGSFDVDVREVWERHFGNMLTNKRGVVQAWCEGAVVSLLMVMGFTEEEGDRQEPLPRRFETE